MAIFFESIRNPSILFFFLGLLSVFFKTKLEFAHPIPKLLSMILLFSIGINGGYKIYQHGISTDFLAFVLLATLFALAIPLISYLVLSKMIDRDNAIAIACSYGSVSAVTFITAISMLQERGLSYHGYMVAIMAWMESPAIIAGLVLYHYLSNAKEKFQGVQIFQKAFFNGSVFLLLGSLAIGYVIRDKGMLLLKPLTTDLFNGVLALFMLDMGIVAGLRFSDFKKVGVKFFAFGTIFPLVMGILGVWIGLMVDDMLGNAVLFGVLLASASYIAVPAVVRSAIPEANPSLYVSMALAVTFPFNIAIGLPIYVKIAELLSR